jgi:ATP-binding cassette, subfamily C (CFTR/MRP), member 1
MTSFHHFEFCGECAINRCQPLPPFLSQITLDGNGDTETGEKEGKSKNSSKPKQFRLGEIRIDNVDFYFDKTRDRENAAREAGKKEMRKKYLSKLENKASDTDTKNGQRNSKKGEPTGQTEREESFKIKIDSPVLGNRAKNTARETKNVHEPAMANVKLHVEPGSLVVCLGAFASGKTFLLTSILGETFSAPHGSDGEKTAAACFFRSDSRVAYVPQTAWVLNDTIRNNILFGSEYDETKYRDTVIACALAEDLARLPAGTFSQ